MKKPLGCLSPSGLLAAFLTILVITGVSAVQGGALFSPGALNAQAGPPLGQVSSHADLANNCSACHTLPLFGPKMDARCLDCHTDIQAQLQDPRSLHAVLASSHSVISCRLCHTEHKGAAAAITTLDIENFPHELVGFSLKAHTSKADGTPFQCEDCHNQEVSKLDAAVCFDCHHTLDAAFMQTHSGQFGQACLGCHDGLDRYGKDFDHNRFRFPLLGRHAAVECADCHAGAVTAEMLQSAPLECEGCHVAQDIHKGQFGSQCGVCHTPEGWEKASFDHSQTAFPLLGKHQQVACDSCHKDNQYKGTPLACFACHQGQDAHRGEFGEDCGACHTPEGWEKASFDHSRTAFPLTGAHLNLACKACHSTQVFKGTPAACSACHQEPAYHAGLFGSECAACHTTNAWYPADFNRPHTFPLRHGGAGTCRDCHTAALGGYTCYTCHNRAETIAEHSEEGIANIDNCVSCHAGGQKGDEGEDGGGDDDDD